MIEELTPFYTTIKDPEQTAQSIKTKGKKILGYLCSYAPEELIFAAGCHPMRLFSRKTEISLAENHLQAYCCSLVRGILEQGLSGDLNYLDGTVFPHTCDSIQRLSDIWRLNMDQAFFADVIMPAKLTTASARDYMKTVLNKFKTDLESYIGHPITEDDLAESIALFNRIRTRLDQIYTLKAEHPAVISGKDLFCVIKAAMIMDRNLLDTCLKDLLSALKNLPQKPGDPTRLILSGSVCDMPDLYTLVEDAGGAVVGDDLCSGQRWFQGLIPQDLPPMDGLTARYTDRVVCPAKHSGNFARAKALIDLVKAKKAQGVVFTLLKFCDPHAFDFPYLKECLDKEGIPSLHLEMDDQQTNSGQMTTRVETFIQMI
ncbi:MAG: 2-hydroxyacyl-CoA dehydratase [Desulfobacter sp.]|nr:2-hydroxyacyl-CoA dehydratase [Desulfobacter sp.]WDP86503.1 MAG: 2-hydroxyacyl-CoA dehydratase [Desulfobacter sp.]